MSKIDTTISNFTMSLNDYLATLLPRRIALLELFNLVPLPLCLSQFGLSITKEAGVIYLYTVTQVGKMLKPQIYPDRTALMEGRDFNLSFHRENDVPLIAVFFEGYSFDLAHHFPVQLDLNRPYLGQVQFIVFETPTALGEGDRVETVLPLKRG